MTAKQAVESVVGAVESYPVHVTNDQAVQIREEYQRLIEQQDSAEQTDGEQTDSPEQTNVEETNSTNQTDGNKTDSPEQTDGEETTPTE